MKKFSVIIPVYNTEKYLKQCLDSVLAYSGENLEVIALDDGSTDSSPAILDSYSDPRLKVIHKENEGVFKTWKQGVKISTGDYIVFVDSDDYISEELFPELNKLFSERDYDLVQFGWVNLNPHKNSVVENPFVNFSEGAYTGERLKNILEANVYVAENAKVEKPLGIRWGKVFSAKKLKEILPELMDDIIMFEDGSLIIPFFFLYRVSVYPS